MSKPVLLAGVLGGVLGAIIGFALMRAFPPDTKPAPPTVPTAPPDGHAFVEDLIAKMKAGKEEGVKELIRPAYRNLSDTDFEEKMWKPYLALRKHFPDNYGKSQGFELAKEHVISSKIVRFTYIEHFAYDCLVWSIVCYDSPEGWRITSFQNLTVDSAVEFLK